MLFGYNYPNHTHYSIKHKQFQYLLATFIIDLMGIERLTERLDESNLTTCTDVLKEITNPNRIVGATLEEVNLICDSVSKIIAERRKANPNDVVWVSIVEHRDEFLRPMTDETARTAFVRAFRSTIDGTINTVESDMITPKDFQTFIGVHGYSNGSDELKGFAWLTSIVDNHQKGFITPIGTQLRFGSRTN